MINLYDILEAADGQLFGEPAAQIFSDFCFDARKVQKGELYVALKTERGDGHHAMPDAVAGGATGIMCTHPPSFDTEGLTVVVMRSVEDALMRWSEIVLQKYGTTVVGVTGTMGQSITRATIAQVLGTRFRVHTHGDIPSGRFGLPLALGRLSKDHQIAVVEFGAERPGEMADMVAITNPMVGVVTFVGRAHTDRFGSPELIAQEKSALIQGLPPEGLAVLNFDDPLVQAMQGETNAPVLTVGLDRTGSAFGADLLAYNLLVDRYKTGFDLKHGTERFPGRWVPLLGVHQLYGALAALAVGLSYEVPLAEGLHALTEMEPLPGRMCPLGGPGGSLLVDDSYTSSPEEFAAALDWLDAVRDDRGQSVLVMGDMDNLGGYTSLAHIEAGQRAAAVVDRLVTHGDLAADSARVALEQGLDRDRVAVTFSAEDAAQAASHDLGPYDVVVVKGSVSGRLERVVRRLLADVGDAEQLVRQTGLQESIQIERQERPTWVEIDLEAIAYNTRRIKEIVGPEVGLLAVVRANAYGHGAIPVSSTVLNNGAEMIGVASLNEALELRDAGIDAPILVLGYTPPWAAAEVLRHDLTVSLYDVEIARVFDRAARDLDTQVRAHLKVDTGNGMMGMLPEDVTLFFRSMRNLNNVQVEGLYTELSVSADNPDYTSWQVTAFEGVIDPLLAAGFRFRYIHAADSAAAIHLPETHFNMVRPGSALYGLNPGPLAPLPADFRPALAWKTVVAQVKRLPPGSFVGDGNTYRTQATQRIALIPVGYADGFRRGSLTWPYVLIKGETAPLVGQVGIDLCAVDVTHLDDVQIGEEVVLIGSQGRRSISAEDVADALETSPYEVVCTVLARVPRVK